MNNYCSSLAACAFSKRNILKQCFKHTFGRINELLIVSIFHDHILLIFTKETGTRETSLDNQKVQIIEVRRYS